MSDVQSGFRTGLGCITATLKVLDDIITIMDNKQVCIAAFIDLVKALDSVDHNILLHPLQQWPVQQLF